MVSNTLILLKKGEMRKLPFKWQHHNRKQYVYNVQLNYVNYVRAFILSGYEYCMHLRVLCAHNILLLASLTCLGITCTLALECEYSINLG